MSAHGHRGFARGCRLRLLAVSPVLLAGGCSAPPSLPEPPDAYVTAAQIAHSVGWQLAGAEVPADRVTLARVTAFPMP